MDLILVAAAKFEIDPLEGSLQQIGHYPKRILTGIGSINAAKKVPSLIDNCRGKHAIFVGTCGSFTTTENVKLVRISKVHWLPTGERTGLSYTVKDSAPPIDLPQCPNWCAELPAREAICSPTISLIKTLPESFDPKKCVENLELYSCAAEIASVAKSFAVILAVTNTVGPDAHTQWRTNFAAAAGLTAEFITHKLPALS